MERTWMRREEEVRDAGVNKLGCGGGGVKSKEEDVRGKVTAPLSVTNQTADNVSEHKKMHVRLVPTGRDRGKAVL